MTDNERVLHTVLSTCNKKFYKTVTAHDEVDMLQNRLDEIRQIVAPQVALNARRSIARSIEHNKKGE